MASKIKTKGMSYGKSNKLGGGGRFAQLTHKLAGKVSNPSAVAAAIGRKKYGAKKFGKLASKGRSRKVMAGSKKMLAMASKATGSKY